MRLLLIEDDTVIAELIVRGMKEAGFAIDNETNGISGLNRALNDGYDLAIIDLMLPGLNGLSIIERIREKHMTLPIIILSAKRNVDDRIEGLRHGSDDYLTKPFSFSELLARVEALIRRSTNVAEPSSLQYEDLSLDLLSRTVQRNNNKITLQPREFALLEYLMRNAGRVVSKTMIMERVWNYNFDPNTNVVEARVSKLREKVDKGYEKSLIQTVRGLGYVLKIAS
jgi:two-component system OmpR family response regulator